MDQCHMLRLEVKGYYVDMNGTDSLNDSGGRKSKVIWMILCFSNR